MPSSNFIDYIKLNVRSGKGGAGSKHFHRDRTTTKGGPDGGNGGRGGHIIMQGNSQLWTLLHLKYRKHVIAKLGKAGSEQNREGAHGKDIIIEVPLGTIAKENESAKIVGEIITHNQKIILARGGRGGKGNAFFANPSNQTPQHAQPGESGEDKWIILELKLLADVGLVGFPNAGKSTLISMVSAAKPKIASYPFTTLTPQLGVVAYREQYSFVMADIPGIIQGAAQGKGLGTQFLKHIEHNAVLLFIIASDSKNIIDDYHTLLNELKQHDAKLLDKEHAIAISKMDLIHDDMQEQLKRNITRKIPHIPIIFFSSITAYGINQLKDMVWQQIQASR